MPTGRTHWKHLRFYGDGYDLSGYARSTGELGVSFAEAEGETWVDPIKGALPDIGEATIGTFNGVFDATASVGLHAVWSGSGVNREIMIPWGIRAAPAEGDVVFCGTFLQLGYKAQPNAGNIVTVAIPFGNWGLNAASLLYAQVWGDLAHEKSAETGANSGTAIIDNLASSALGGYMAYQMFSSDGTATIKIQDASTNSDGSFGDLVSAGELNASSTPKAGIVVLGKTATVKRYIRWQLALNSASTVTFALAFVRGA